MLTQHAFHFCICDNAYRPQRSVSPYNLRGSPVSTHVFRCEIQSPSQDQDSGLNLPRFCVMAWTFLLSSSNFLISSACSAFFLSRSWKR